MKYILIMLFFTAMVSCSQMQFENTAELKKNMTKNETNKLIDNSNFNIDYQDGNIFDLSKYGLESKGKVELVISKIVFGTDSPSLLRYIADFRFPNYSRSGGGGPLFYMFAFHNDKLIYWGYPQEFARENDSMINQIGEIGSKIIKDKFI